MTRIVAWCLMLASPCAADCILHGTVVDGISGKLLPGTRVFAQPHGKTAAPAILRVADAAGSFCFEHLDKGDYEVIADRPSYLTTIYGARPGDQSGTVFVIGPAVQIPALRVQMLAGASISGTVTDSAGQPLPGYEIYLLRRAWRGGGWAAEPRDGRIADDRGLFRFAPVAPGTYYLRADAPRSATIYLDENGQPARPSEVRTYYPAALTLERATAISVAPGQEIANVTLPLARSVPRRISGHVTGVTWTPGPHPVVRLVADQQTVLFFVEVPLNPDGSFVAENLYPTSYSVGVIGASRYFVRTVDVTTTDADGVVLAPDPPGVDLRISLDANGEPDPPNLLLLDLGIGATRPVRRDNQGVYRSSQLPGRYRVKTAGGPSYIDHVIVDGRARPDAVVDLQPGSTAEIRAVLAAANSKIEAHVVLPPNSLAVTLVWLDLADATPNPEGESKTVPSNGILEVPSLAPGKYRLFAIEGFDRAPWGCPDLTAALMPKSVEIELKPLETRKVDVPLVTASEWDAALRKIGM